MAVLPIIKYPDPVLRKKAETVTKITKPVKKLIRDMFDTMNESGGIGLAAPQVGVSKRIIVVDISSKENGASKPVALVNPEVVFQEGEVEGDEGCLSFPSEARGLVARALKITIRGINEQGKVVSFQAVDLLGRALQHEVDHLNGILFIDRMSVTQMMKIRAILSGGSEVADGPPVVERKRILV